MISNFSFAERVIHVERKGLPRIAFANLGTPVKQFFLCDGRRGDMRQWNGSSLAQVIKNKFQWNLNDNTRRLIQENTFEMVLCKIADQIS